LEVDYGVGQTRLSGDAGVSQRRLLRNANGETSTSMAFTIGPWSTIVEFAGLRRL
jgi:hypothetical protein